MKRILLFISITLSLSANATSSQPNKETNQEQPETLSYYHTDLSKGCDIMTNMADLAMHYRQTGYPLEEAKKAITSKKFMKKIKRTRFSEEKEVVGRNLEEVYHEILSDVYKVDIVEKNEEKQKVTDLYTNAYYKKCLLSPVRF